MWFYSLCKDAGLQVRVEGDADRQCICALGFGSEPGLAAIGTGSHIDAIPHAGSYDGTVGVLGGLEAIRALNESGFRPRRSIELLPIYGRRSRRGLELECFW